MTTKGRKTAINLALKIAIVNSGKTQRRLALATRIGEVKLSAIVHGHRTPSAREREALAKVLGCDENALFPQPEAAVAS